MRHGEKGVLRQALHGVDNCCKDFGLQRWAFLGVIAHAAGGCGFEGLCEFGCVLLDHSYDAQGDGVTMVDFDPSELTLHRAMNSLHAARPEFESAGPVDSADRGGRSSCSTDRLELHADLR